MAYRWHPKNAEVDESSPRGWGTCDRCGFIWNLHNLQWQFDYNGSSTLQNLRLLVCDKCYDVPQPQNTPNILPPDPPPLFNTRPEPYALDETSWLTTEDDDIITTQDGTPFITPIPNPGADAAAARLQIAVRASGASVAVLYLDLFDGNPLTTGVSVLSRITGSSTRTNLASVVATVAGITRNPDQIVIAAESDSITNVSYAGFYSAASGGSLLMSGTVAVSGPTITAGHAVVIDALGLNINTN